MRDLHRYADDYVRDYGFERWQVAFRREAVLRHTAHLPRTHVLEVGCGLEPLFDAMPARDGWCVVEPSAPFARVARQRAADRSADGASVTVIEGLLETSVDALMDLSRTRPFDLIVVSGVLQEVADPQAFLDAIRRVCTPETVVHLNVPNARSLHRLTAVAMGLLTDARQPSPRAAMLQQRTVYDRESLLDELRGAGFSPEADGGILLKPFDHARMVVALEHGVLAEEHLRAYASLADVLPDLASELWVNARCLG